MSIKYLNKECCLKDKFFHLRKMERIDVENYFQIIKDILTENNLIHKVYFIATDGANTMIGQ